MEYLLDRLKNTFSTKKYLFVGAEQLLARSVYLFTNDTLFFQIEKLSDSEVLRVAFSGIYSHQFTNLFAAKKGKWINFGASLGKIKTILNRGSCLKSHLELDEFDNGIFTFTYTHENYSLDRDFDILIQDIVNLAEEYLKSLVLLSTLSEERSEEFAASVSFIEMRRQGETEINFHLRRQIRYAIQAGHFG